MYPIQLHDYRKGMQTLALCSHMTSGSTRFYLPSGVYAFGETGFQTELVYPLMVSEIRDNAVSLVLPRQELLQDVITTGMVHSKEDMGYVLLFYNYQRGFLPYAKSGLIAKQTRYIPVRVVSVKQDNVLLELFKVNYDYKAGKTVSPGSKVRGTITQFTEVQAQVECVGLSHFSAKLAFQYFRRTQKGADCGFYKGFEDDFIVLAVDYYMNQLFLSCEFEYRWRSLNSVLTSSRYLLGQKVLLKQVRVYLQVDLSLHSQDDKIIAKQPEFESTWLYVNYSYFKTCNKLQFPPDIGQVVPVLSIKHYQYFENAFYCFAVNALTLEEALASENQVNESRKNFPFYIGQRLPKIYEVFVDQITPSRFYASTSYYADGYKNYVKVYGKPEFFDRIAPKQNLSSTYKLTVVEIKARDLNSAPSIVVSPLSFDENTLNQETLKTGDFGSGIPIHRFEQHQYSVVQIFGGECICFYMLEVQKPCSFSVVFRSPGQPAILHYTDSRLPKQHILQLYARSPYKLIIYRFANMQFWNLGSVFYAQDLLLVDFSAGCLICRWQGQHFILPVDTLAENDITNIFENKLYDYQLSLYTILPHQSYKVIKHFGQYDYVRTIIAPSDLWQETIHMRAPNPAIITRIADAFYIATLFNGAEAHIRFQDSFAQCHLLQLVSVLVIRQVSANFYIGRVIGEPLDFEDTFVPYQRPQFRAAKVALTDNLNDMNTLDSAKAGQKLRGELLVFQPQLPYPYLIVDIGSGLLGRLDFRGLFSSKDFTIERIKALLSKENYELVFKEVVKQYSEKQGSSFTFYANKVVDYIGEQVYYLTFSGEQNAGLSVLDLDLFEEKAESAISQLVYRDQNMALCLLLQRKNPSILVLTNADLDFLGNSFVVGDVFESSRCGIKPLHGDVVSKLCHNAVPPKVLFWDYEYYCLDCATSCLANKLILRPYMHYEATLSASYLNHGNNLQTRVSPAAVSDNGRSDIVLLSPFDIACCDWFVPQTVFYVHHGMVLRAVVAQILPMYVKLSLGIAGSARLFPQEGQLFKVEQVIDVVVEKVEGRDVIVSYYFGNLTKAHDAGVTARTFYATMVRNKNGIICQLDKVFPRVFCRLRGLEFAYGRSEFVEVQRIDDELVATPIQKGKRSFVVYFGDVKLVRQFYPAYYTIYSNNDLLSQELKRSGKDFNIYIQTLQFCGAPVRQLEKLYSFDVKHLRGQDLLNYCNAKLQLCIETQKDCDEVIRGMKEQLGDDFNHLVGQFLLTKPDTAFLEKYAPAEQYPLLCLQIGQLLTHSAVPGDIDVGVNSELAPVAVEALLSYSRQAEAEEFLLRHARNLPLLSIKQALAAVIGYVDDKQLVVRLFDALSKLNYGRQHKRVIRAIQEDYDNYLKFRQ